MASRTTLPEVNPLEQLGIGSYARRPPPTQVVRQRPRAERAQTIRRAAERASEEVTQVGFPTRRELETNRSEAASEKQPSARAERLESAPQTERAGQENAAEPPRPAKVKFNARIPDEVANQVRDCVVALYSTHGLTIDGLAAEALRREVERLKKSHYGGQDFPVRERGPKPGRPVR